MSDEPMSVTKYGTTVQIAETATVGGIGSPGRRKQWATEGHAHPPAGLP